MLSTQTTCSKRKGMDRWLNKCICNFSQKFLSSLREDPLHFRIPLLYDYERNYNHYIVPNERVHRFVVLKTFSKK